MTGRSGLAVGFPEPLRKHCLRQLVAITGAINNDDEDGSR